MRWYLSCGLQWNFTDLLKVWFQANWDHAKRNLETDHLAYLSSVKSKKEHRAWQSFTCISTFYAFTNTCIFVNVIYKCVLIYVYMHFHFRKGHIPGVRYWPWSLSDVCGHTEEKLQSSVLGVTRMRILPVLRLVWLYSRPQQSWSWWSYLQRKIREWGSGGERDHWNKLLKRK